MKGTFFGQIVGFRWPLCSRIASRWPMSNLEDVLHQLVTVKHSCNFGLIVVGCGVHSHLMVGCDGGPLL